MLLFVEVTGDEGPSGDRSDLPHEPQHTSHFGVWATLGSGEHKYGTGSTGVHGGYEPLVYGPGRGVSAVATLRIQSQVIFPLVECQGVHENSALFLAPQRASIKGLMVSIRWYLGPLKG